MYRELLHGEITKFAAIIYFIIYIYVHTRLHHLCLNTIYLFGVCFFYSDFHYSRWALRGVCKACNQISTENYTRGRRMRTCYNTPVIWSMMWACLVLLNVCHNAKSKILANRDFLSTLCFCFCFRLRPELGIFN